jgi:hypothetical protein
MQLSAILSFTFRLWPGFHRLWHKGDFHALMVSLLFSWLFVLAWLATFVWPEWLFFLFGTKWIAKTLLTALWILVAGFSLMSAMGIVSNAFHGPTLAPDLRRKNLENAQELYLQANYFDAEKLIRLNLNGPVEDVESSLLWIAILRRTRRIQQAIEVISQIDKLDVALLWSSELRSEREQCIRIKLQTPPPHD